MFCVFVRQRPVKALFSPPVARREKNKTMQGKERAIKNSIKIH